MKLIFLTMDQIISEENRPRIWQLNKHSFWTKIGNWPRDMFNKQAQFCIKMEETKVGNTTEWTCQYGEKVK